MSGRQGFSCDRCGEWFFADAGLPAGVVCPVCAGRLRARGPVRRDGRVYGSAEVPACDGRCTSALGVHCDCQCGGVNHGSGRVVTVVWVAGAPRVDLADVGLGLRLRAERLPAIAEAERLAAVLVDRLEKEYRDVLAQYRAGGWVQDFGRLLEWRTFRTGVRHGLSLRTPKGRLGALRRLESEIAGMSPAVCEQGVLV